MSNVVYSGIIMWKWKTEKPDLLLRQRTTIATQPGKRKRTARRLNESMAYGTRTSISQMPCPRRPQRHRDRIVYPKRTAFCVLLARRVAKSGTLRDVEKGKGRT